jgi:hypothetical protein
MISIVIVALTFATATANVIDGRNTVDLTVTSPIVEGNNILYVSLAR